MFSLDILHPDRQPISAVYKLAYGATFDVKPIGFMILNNVNGMILLEKRYVTLERDDQSKCLTQTWKGFAKSEDFREAIKHSLEIIKKGEVDKIISDTKEASLVKKEDTQWVAEVITPQMVQHGLRYMAFIIPTSVFTQMAIDNFKEKADEVVKIGYFDQVDKATAWLQEVEE